MHAQILPLLLLFSRAVSARTIDVHVDITDDNTALHQLSGDDFSPAASCYWDGTSPFCAGGCPGGYSDCATSSCGDGACCVTGYKKYCCRGGCSNLQGLQALVPDARPSEVQHEHVPAKADVKKPEVVDESAPSRCYWDGTSPFCAGGCSSGYSDCGTSSCGDGACCVTGWKKYCCRGGCTSSYDPFAAKPRVGDEPHGKDGDNDDVCGEDEFICCPPAASRNKECKCLKKEKPKQFLRSLSQKPLTDDGPDSELCKEKETLCCNPGAKSNDECSCIEE